MFARVLQTAPFNESLEEDDSRSVLSLQMFGDVASLSVAHRAVTAIATLTSLL